MCKYVHLHRARLWTLKRLNTGRREIKNIFREQCESSVQFLRRRSLQKQLLASHYISAVPALFCLTFLRATPNYVENEIQRVTFTSYKPPRLYTGPADATRSPECFITLSLADSTCFYFHTSSPPSYTVVDYAQCFTHARTQRGLMYPDHRTDQWLYRPVHVILV